VCPVLCAEGDAAKSNFIYKQHATRDLLRRLQQQGRLMGQAAGSAAPPAGCWPQFGNLLDALAALRGGRRSGCKQYTAANGTHLGQGTVYCVGASTCGALKGGSRCCFFYLQGRRAVRAVQAGNPTPCPAAPRGIFWAPGRIKGTRRCAAGTVLSSTLLAI
jgi:hypothetical protein